MSIKDLFMSTNQALTDLVLHVKPEQFDLVMPKYASLKDGQTLRMTLNILAYENQCVPKVLAGQSNLAGNADFAGDLLLDDAAGNYAAFGDQANQAVRDHPEMEKIVHISYGDFPASSYLTDISIQRCLSIYDLSALTGIEAGLPKENLIQLLEIAQSYGDYLREAGIFPPEVKLLANATVEDKLLGYTGRQPKDAAILA